MQIAYDEVKLIKKEKKSQAYNWSNDSNNQGIFTYSVL